MKSPSAHKKTKDLIVDLLSEQWPLRTKQIHSFLKNKGLTVTYQAIHLSLKELETEFILIQDKKMYYLNPVWITSMAKRFNTLSEHYLRENKITTPQKYQEISFSSIKECWEFLLSSIQTGFFGDSDKCYLQVGRLFAVMLPREQIDFLKEYTSEKTVIVMCRRNGIIDKFAANYLRSLGAKVFTGIPCAFPTNTLLIGNCVVSIFILYPDDVEKGMAEFQKSISLSALLSKDFLEYFSRLMGSKMTVKIIINRDPDVRKDVLLQTLKLLKNPKSMH